MIIMAYVYPDSFDPNTIEKAIMETLPKDLHIDDFRSDPGYGSRYAYIYYNGDNNKSNQKDFCLEYHRSPNREIKVKTNKGIKNIKLIDSLCLECYMQEYSNVPYSIMEDLCKKFGGYLMSPNYDPDKIYYTHINKLDRFDKIVEEFNKSKNNIKYNKCECSQYMGTLFDNFKQDEKFSIKDKFRFTRIKVEDFLDDLKYTAINCIKWFKVIPKLRPYEGFDGTLQIIKHHLKDYLRYEINYGHSEDEYKQEKIYNIRRCLELIDKLRKDEYTLILTDAINQKYPKYYNMISEGKVSTSYSGKFTKFKDGWVGIEGGKNPRKGYFIHKDGRFVLTESPDEKESNRLLKQIEQYELDITEAIKLGAEHKEKDLNELMEILRKHFFEFWD